MNELFEFLMTPSSLNVFTVYALKTTLVSSLGLLLWVLLKTASASARHLVLTATLLAALAIPIVPSISPTLFVPIAAPEVAPVARPVASQLESRPKMTVQDQVVTRARVNVNSSSPAGGLEVHINTLVFFVIGAVSLIIFFHLALGIFQLWHISRRANTISEDDRWYQLLPSNSKGRVRLLLSDKIAAPHTWGFRKPVIVLPTASSIWSEQNKKNALRHELSHIDRNDWIIQIVARSICAVYWFNPLVWFVYHKLILEAERAADDRVLLSGGVAHDYAEQLVALTKNPHRPLTFPLAATSMAAKNLLPDRIRSILNTGVRRMPLHTFGKLAILVSITSMSVLIGSAQLAYAHSDNDGDHSFFSSSKRTTPLIHAAANGDFAEVQRLINNGADVNETRRVRGSSATYQRSALTTAAKAGHADIVELLIDSGAPVDRIVDGDATALIEALKENHVDVARLLIDRSANVTLTVRGDGSPLIAAAIANNADMVKLLLDKGANPDDWIRGDASVLFHAAKRGNSEIVRLLIDASVDVNQQMKGDGNALIIATRKGHTDVIRLLMNAGARADVGIRGDGNAMIMAAAKGDIDSLSFMIETGNNVDASVKGDGSPLIAAARHGHIDAVKLLLQNGASIDKVVYGDENALIGAAWAGDLAMVELLLAAGANPNVKARTYRNRFRTALSQAKLGDHQEVIDVLLSAGAKE